eukprot:1880006-Karenia_brevis.AAC.1
MAALNSSPSSEYRVDCKAVHDGTQRGLDWASAPGRRLARAWAPLAAALDGDPRKCVWMPAHCTQAH